ncbi:MAG: DUF1476 domain-containing protein [Pseudomonadota bacterium]
MTTFNDREKAFENKFSHDMEMNFRAESRRTKNLALWAGKEMGLNEQGTVLYAKKVLQVSIEQPGLEHVIAKVEEDLKMAGITPEKPVKDMAEYFLSEAKASLMRDLSD